MIADGNLIVVRVNDQKVIEYTAPDNRITAGRVALQPDGDSVVRFRKVEIKELPPTKPAGEKPPE